MIGTQGMVMNRVSYSTAAFEEAMDGCAFTTRSRRPRARGVHGP